MVSRPLEPEAAHTAGGKLTAYAVARLAPEAGFFCDVPHEGGGRTMTIRINGQETECTPGVSLLEFLEGRGLDVRSVVVEHNRTIIVTEKLEEIRLAAGDELEILHFVGGG